MQNLYTIVSGESIRDQKILQLKLRVSERRGPDTGIYLRCKRPPVKSVNDSSPVLHIQLPNDLLPVGPLLGWHMITHKVGVENICPRC